MNSKVSIHKYPNEYSTSQSSWTGGMVSHEAAKQQPSSKRTGSDSVPYEYQPHQSKMKKPVPNIGTNYQQPTEPSSSKNSTRKPSSSSMRNTRSQQQLVEDSPRSTSSLSSQNDQYEDEEEMTEDSNCIGFRLWEFPLMYIQKPEGPYGRNDTQESRMFNEGFKQTSFYGTGMMRNQEKVTSNNMLFRTGKSVAFSMERMELGQYIQTLPLYVFLFILTASPSDMTYGGSMADPSMGRSNWKPVLIGSVSIPLNELRVSDEIDAPKGARIPQKRTISGTFTMKNDRGYDIGVIDMDVRLRSLVKTGPIDNFNEYLTQNFSKSFSLQRPMTSGGPHSGTMDKSLRMQTGAVTRNPLFTVTDNTFQNQPQPVHNTFNPMLGTMANNGEMGALSTLVQHYKDTQAQTMMMRGQIENQINTMANQLADISRQLKGEPERFVEERPAKKKLKKKTAASSSGKILNTQPIKRPSSANPSRPNSLSNSTKTVDSLSMRKKNVTLGRNTNSYLEQPAKDWYHVLHGTSTVRKPQSASSSTKSSMVKKKASTPSSASSSMKASKKVDKSVRLEEELARHVLENLHQQQEDDERQGTTMSGLIPQLAETLKLLARKSQKQEDEEPEEMITIPSELYRTIKENNDRYNNLQRSYQAIMEEFVDNPNKLFSSMTKVDTRGMSFREKELWKNQNKLITLLRDNYNQIKKEKDMSALKDVKSSHKRSPIIESSVKKPSPRKVEEVEASTDSSSSSSEEEKKKKKEKKEKKDKKKDKKEKKKAEQMEVPQEEEEQDYQVSQFHGDHDPTPVIEIEEPQEDEPQPQEEESYAYQQPQSAQDFLKEYDDEDENQNYEPQHDTSQMFQTQANQNPMEMMTATDAYLPLSASLGVSEIKTTGETETSFGDFEEFDNSHFDNSEPPQSDTLRTEDFSVVHVSQDNSTNNNNYYEDQQYQPQEQQVVEEEEFEDFDNDFEEQHDENQEPEDETYEEQEEGHQEQEVVDSVDYSGIEDRTEEERI